MYDPEAADEFPGPIIASLPVLGEGRPSAQTLSELAKGSRMMVAVDMDGVHDIPVVFCSCPNASREDIQLLELGLYPASKLRPRTVFTTRTLDDFLLSNRACHTTPRQYFNKLRRATDAAFPHTVPVRTCSDTTSRHWQLLISIGRIATKSSCVCLANGEISRSASGPGWAIAMRRQIRGSSLLPARLVQHPTSTFRKTGGTTRRSK